MARGLTTIAARIASSDGKDALAEYGIEVENLDGSLRSTYDVLGDVARIWGDLTDVQRTALGETLAGKTRYNILAAVLQNYGHAVEATNTAMESQGSASKENEAYMGSLEAKLTNLTGLFQELSQSVVDSGLVGGLMDLAGTFLELANTPIGTFVTQVGLLAGALSGIYGMAKAGILSGLNLPALGTVAPYIIGITTAVLGLRTAINLVKKQIEEKAEAKIFDNVADDIKESETKIKDYDRLISDSKDKLNELKQIPWGDRTTEIDFEIQKLESLIQQYETLREEEVRRVKEDQLKKLRGTQFEAGYGMTEVYDANLVKLEERYKGFTEVYEKARSGYYGSIEDAALAFGKVMDIAFNTDDDLASRTAEVMAVLESNNVFLQRTFRGWTEELQASSSEMQEYSASLKDLDAVNDDTVTSLQDLIDKNQDYYDTLRIVKKYGGELSEEETNFMKQYESLSSILSQVTIGTDKLNAARKKAEDLKGSAEFARHTLTLKDYVDTLTNIDGINTSNIESVLGYLKAIGALDLDYTASDLQEIIDGINSVESKTVDINVDAHPEDAEEGIDAIKEELDSASGEIGVTITSSADAANLLESLNHIKTLIGELNALPVTITINVNSSVAISRLGAVRSAVNNIPSSKTITVSVNDLATSTLSNIFAMLNQLQDKTVKVKIDREDTTNGRATGTNYFGGGEVLINDGAPVNGSAAELVVADGKARIYNNGEPTVENLPRGAKIYTAAQTQQILKNIQALKDSIPSFASGNITVPSEINADTIQYTPSQYYSQGGFGPFYDQDSFENWVKERKHLLELDKITEEQYYLDLEEMNETYYKNIADSQDKYWSYQEEIYKWKKQRLEDENELLEKQIELEKALGDLAKIKSQKILVFKNGQFQYMADVDAISEAQRNINNILSGKGYAEGTTNAKAGLHLVGENGPELRVLNDGDGIIPNNLTNKLLNMARNGTNGLANTAEKAKQVFYSFDISNLSLPNVKNAEDFFDGLKNYAYQYSYA